MATAGSRSARRYARKRILCLARSQARPESHIYITCEYTPKCPTTRFSRCFYVSPTSGCPPRIDADLREDCIRSKRLATACVR